MGVGFDRLRLWVYVSKPRKRVLGVEWESISSGSAFGFTAQRKTKSCTDGLPCTQSRWPFFI